MPENSSTPPTRRELRALQSQQDSSVTPERPADSFFARVEEPTQDRESALDASPSESHGSVPSGSKGRRRRRRALWITLSCLALVVVAAAALGWAGARVYAQAMDARSHLLAAMPYAQEFRTALLAGDTAGAETAAQAFEAEAARAASATSGRVWGILESVPLPPAENLRAVKIVAQAADELGAEVFLPASSISLAALTPQDGRIDLGQLETVGAVVAGADESVEALAARMEGIDHDALIPQVRQGVEQVADAVAELRPLLTSAADALTVLPPLLGADGPRNYLLMFLGNSELRAAGGGPGSFIQLRAENGAVSIVQQAAATEFRNAREEPIAPLDAESEALYSDILGRWITNLTGTADFSTSAELARAWWAEKSDDQIDGVMSVDPVALSYLLPATGPIALPTGEELTADNAVALLLNQVYYDYPTGVESNVFFDGAAAAIFTKILSGSPQPTTFLEGVVRSADEGRIHFWSANEEERAVLGASVLAGALPTTNDEASVVGVYFNDTTGSKMDYYVDATIDLVTDQCASTSVPTWTATIGFTNSITREQADVLPSYITGPYYRPGDIATDVIVYAPVGASIESVTVDGKEAKGVRATHLGRSAVRVSILSLPASTQNIIVSFRGAEGEPSDTYGVPQVRHTAMVRDVQVTIDAPGCG